MRPVTVTKSAAGVSSPVVLDIYRNNYIVSLETHQTGTNTAKLQVSYDDPWATYATDYNTDATWIDMAAPFDVLSGTEAGIIPQASGVPRAVRINITAYTSGSVSLNVIHVGLTGV